MKQSNNFTHVQLDEQLILLTFFYRSIDKALQAYG